MERFFFHLDEDGTILEDVEGIELPNLNAAQASAVQAARDIMAHDVSKGWLRLSCAIDIADYAGHHLLKVAFRDAVTISG